MTGRGRWVVAVISMCGLAVLGCGGGGGPTPTPNGDVTPPPGSTPPPSNAAQVRLVHAAPGAPALDLYQQGNATPLVRGVGYAQSSAYANLAPGSYAFEVRPAGAAADSPPLFTLPAQNLAPSSRTTAVAAGVVGAAEASAFRVLWLNEAFAEPASNEAVARIVHAAPDAPAISVDLFDDGSLELEGLGRFEDTTEEGGGVPAGEALQLGIYVDEDTRVSGFTVPALPAGADVFLIATGLASRSPEDPSGFSLLVVGPDGVLAHVRQNPFVFVLHASPDAPALDAFIGEQEILDHLTFGELGDALQAPPGNYTIDFFAHAAGDARPQTGPLLTAGLPELTGGGSFLIGATGFVTPGGPRPLSVQSVAREFTFDPVNARVRAVHWSPDAPTADLGPVTGGTFTPLPDFTGLAYPNASPPAGVSIAPGELVLGLAPTGGDPVAEFPIEVPAGTAHFAVAIGALQPSSGVAPLELLMIDATTIPWRATRVERN